MKFITLIALASAALIAACSSGIDGEYADKTGMVKVKFNKNGKAEYSMAGQVMELNYKIEDNKVKLGPIQGTTMVMSFDKDGCLEGGLAMLGKMCKKK